MEAGASFAMPAKPVWLHRIGDIVADLEILPAPVLDRPAVERMFRLRRRSAIDLMNRFGADAAGKSLVIDRQDLLLSLQAIAGTDVVVRESRRRHRIGDALDQAHRQRAGATVRIHVQPEVFGARLTALPAGVEIGRRALKIEYANGQELLQKLFELGQAIANDFEQFDEITSG